MGEERRGGEGIKGVGGGRDLGEIGGDAYDVITEAVDVW